MTYADAKRASIHWTLAKEEIERHNCSWLDFVAEKGKREYYRGKTILDWLGY